jgi:hypothetical protein
MEKSSKPEKKSNLSLPPLRQTSPAYSARERCQAVLSVWTEKRKPAEVCREYKIKWVVLGQWQDRALEGMLQALEPRVNLERGPALSPRLQQLLEKRSRPLRRPETGANRLSARLARLQEAQNIEKSEKPEMKPA